MSKLRNQSTISKCLLENVEKELRTTEAKVETNPSRPENLISQKQTVMERSKQAASLSSQSSEGGLFWERQTSNGGPSCDFPLPQGWKSVLPSWQEIEP